MVLKVSRVFNQESANFQQNEIKIAKLEEQNEAPRSVENMMFSGRSGSSFAYRSDLGCSDGALPGAIPGGRLLYDPM